MSFVVALMAAAASGCAAPLDDAEAAQSKTISLSFSVTECSDHDDPPDPDEYCRYNEDGSISFSSIDPDVDPPPTEGEGPGTGDPSRRGFCWIEKIRGQLTAGSHVGVRANGGWERFVELNPADADRSNPVPFEFDTECIRFEDLAPFTSTSGWDARRSSQELRLPGSLTTQGNGAAIFSRGLCPLTEIEGPLSEPTSGGQQLTTYVKSPEAGLDPIIPLAPPLPRPGDMRVQRGGPVATGADLIFRSECSIFVTPLGTPGNPWKWHTGSGDRFYRATSGAPDPIQSTGFLRANTADDICYLAGFRIDAGGPMSTEINTNAAGDYQVVAPTGPSPTAETIVECIPKDQS